MSFALTFVGLLYLFFAVGRLLWPDPDGSLDRRNHEEFRKMLGAARGYSPLALLHKLSLPLIITVFFPYLKPIAGIAISAFLIGLAVVL